MNDSKEVVRGSSKQLSKSSSNKQICCKENNFMEEVGLDEGF